MDKEFKFLFGFFMVTFLMTVFAVEPLIRFIVITSQMLFGDGIDHIIFSGLAICFMLYPAGYWSIKISNFIFKK